MREIAMAFICFAGLMVIGSWALTITLAVKSGKGILSLFSRQRKHLLNGTDRHLAWLSVADTNAQYGSDHSNTTD